MAVSVIRRPWAGTLFGALFTALDLLTDRRHPRHHQRLRREHRALHARHRHRRGRRLGSGPDLRVVAGIAVDLALIAGRAAGLAHDHRRSPRRRRRCARAAPARTEPAALCADPLDPAEVAALREEITAAVATSSLILAPLLGAAAGWFGWLLGIVLTGERVRSGPARAGGDRRGDGRGLVLLAGPGDDPGPRVRPAPRNDPGRALRGAGRVQRMADPRRALPRHHLRPGGRHRGQDAPRSASPTPRATGTRSARSAVTPASASCGDSTSSPSPRRATGPSN